MRDDGAAGHRGRHRRLPRSPCRRQAPRCRRSRADRRPELREQERHHGRETADRAPGPDDARATAGAPAARSPGLFEGSRISRDDRSHTPGIDVDGEHACRLRRQPDRRVGNGRRDSARGSCERVRTIRGCFPELFSRKRVAFDSAWVERQPPHVPRLHRASSGRWCSRHRGHHHAGPKADAHSARARRVRAFVQCRVRRRQPAIAGNRCAHPSRGPVRAPFVQLR